MNKLKLIFIVAIISVISAPSAFAAQGDCKYDPNVSTNNNAKTLIEKYCNNNGRISCPEKITKENNNQLRCGNAPKYSDFKNVVGYNIRINAVNQYCKTYRQQEKQRVEECLKNQTKSVNTQATLVSAPAPVATTTVAAAAPVAVATDSGACNETFYNTSNGACVAQTISTMTKLPDSNQQRQRAEISIAAGCNNETTKEDTASQMGTVNSDANTAYTTFRTNALSLAQK